MTTNCSTQGAANVSKPRMGVKRVKEATLEELKQLFQVSANQPWLENKNVSAYSGNWLCKWCSTLSEKKKLDSTV